MESGCVRPSGLLNLVLSAPRDCGIWLCPPFRIVESGFVRPSGLWNLVVSALWDCGIWFCPPFGIVESGCVRPSGLLNLVLSALRDGLRGPCVRMTREYFPQTQFSYPVPDLVALNAYLRARPYVTRARRSGRRVPTGDRVQRHRFVRSDS